MITDEQVARAVRAAYLDAAREMNGSWMPPASARASDCQTLEERQAADAEAEMINHAAMRRILEAAFADALYAMGSVQTLARRWSDIPDHAPSDYDRGRVDQRHMMTAELLAVLPPDPEVS